MATNTKSSNLSKLKPSIGDGPSSSRSKIDLKKKGVEGSIRSPVVDAKNRSAPTVSKMTKNTSSQSTKPAAKPSPKPAAKPATKPKPREKKVFSLAGQKYDVPEEREPLRIFYESLSEQIPSSEMAEFWLMEHGMLSPERSRKAFEKKQRKQKQLRTGMPMKSPPPPPSRSVPSKPESSRRPQPIPKNGDVKAKKRIDDDDDDDDDDFVLSHKRRKA